jgi:hypothetical protein
MRTATAWLMLTLAGLPIASSVQAEGRPSETEQEEAEREAVELELQLQNPITDLVTVQILTTVETGLGDIGANRTVVSVQAQLPIRVTRNWNVLAWTQVPIQSLPGPAGMRVNGIGDTTQYLLLEPSRVRHFLWGVGPIALLPTAIQPALGAGKLAFGPAGLASYQNDWWTVGILVHHLRSIAGAAAGRDVERTFLKPFLSYTFHSGIAVGFESEAMLNWALRSGRRWAVPLQVSVSKVTQVGTLPLNFLLGGRWYVATPAGGPDWGLRLAVSFVIPISRDSEKAGEQRHD